MYDNKVGCCLGSYGKFSLTRALEGTASSGVKYVEAHAVQVPGAHFKPESMTETEMKEARRLIASYGLTPLSVAGHCDLITAEGMQMLRSRVDFALALEAPIVNAATLRDFTCEADREQFIANFIGLKSYIAPRGVTVALETHGDITGKADIFTETLKRIDSDFVKMNYDPANIVYYDGVEPEDDIVGLTGHIAHMHLKDMHGGKGDYDFPAFGEGRLDYPFILRHVLEHGYKGPFCFEIEFTTTGASSPEQVDEALIKSLENYNGIISAIRENRHAR